MADGMRHAVIKEWNISNTTGTRREGLLAGKSHGHPPSYKWLYEFPYPIRGFTEPYNFIIPPDPRYFRFNGEHITTFRHNVIHDMAESVVNASLTHFALEISLSRSGHEKWLNYTPEPFAAALGGLYLAVHSEAEDCRIARYGELVGMIISRNIPESPEGPVPAT